MPLFLMQPNSTHTTSGQDDKKQQQKGINSVYELLSIKQVIRYHHLAAGFPTKTSWLKAINAGLFVSWPMLTARAVAKYFSESTKTQKGVT